MPDHKELVTVEEVQRAIVNRVMTGHYEVGGRLPSVRDLAAELGSNRNTVNKAYQALVGLGVVEAGSASRQGFRVLGLGQLDTAEMSPFREHFRQRLQKLIWEGMAAGLAADDALALSAAAVQTVYETGSVRLAFFECNELDSQEMGSYLEKTLGVPVARHLVSDLSGMVLQRYDLLVTTFHHLAEVAQHPASAQHDRDHLVAIDTRLTPESLLDIARLPESRICIACNVAATAHMLKHVLHGYYPNLQVAACTVDQSLRLKTVASESDHVVATRTCMTEVEALIGRAVDVVVGFQIDDQSLSYLQQKIQKVQSSKLAHTSGGGPLTQGL